MFTISQRGLLCIFGLLFSTGQLTAGVIVRFTEDSGDVIATYSGSLDLTGYTPANFSDDLTDLSLSAANNRFFGNVPRSKPLSGNPAILDPSVPPSRFRNLNVLAFVDSGLDTGGLFAGTYADAEQAFGFFANSDPGNPNTGLYVEPGYASGEAISGRAVFAGSTIAGLFSGTSSFNALVFNDGSNTVTFTAGPAIVPEPTSLSIFAIGGLAFLGVGRRRKSMRSS